MSDFSRRRFLSLLGCAGALLPLTGLLRHRPAFAGTCAKSSEKEPGILTETRPLMGTIVTITLAQASRAQMENAMGMAFERMNGLISIFDRFDSASPLSALNQHGRLGAPNQLAGLLARSQHIHALTGGAFNITVQPLVDLFRRYENPAGEMTIPMTELREARELAQADGLRLNGREARLERNGMGVTLDGIAKGHIADEISRFLLEQGLPHHLINAGGDITAHGEKAPDRAWTVAVENPEDVTGAPLLHGRTYAATLPLRNRALATSGNYRIFYDATRRHHHLIQPASGNSPSALPSVTVAAPTALEADALATALAVMPPVDGLRLIASLPGRECLLINAQGKLLPSAGWRG